MLLHPVRPLCTRRPVCTRRPICIRRPVGAATGAEESCGIEADPFSEPGQFSSGDPGDQRWQYGADRLCEAQP